MARTSRELPKALAEFGQRQFNETGAQAVEVLRVKAAVIRKYWSKLKGIAFLIAVVSLDRVRVYFFSSTGVLLVGENVEHDVYAKIRNKSRLMKKYEKPKPPTDLELRMEATEELRTHLSKSLRRVSRFLGAKEPNFPAIYVSKGELDSPDQSFSMKIDDDGAFIFEEDAINSRIFEGLSLRCAFLSFFDIDKSRESITHCVGNALSSLLLKGVQKSNWDKFLDEYNKMSELRPISNHLLRHLDTYGPDGFSRLLQLLQNVPSNRSLSQWISAISQLHSLHEVTLGTDAWYNIDGFCQSLKKPRKLASRHHLLERIHLAPRVLCNTEPLGFSLGVELSSFDSSKESEWLNIDYRDGNRICSFQVRENHENQIASIYYHLRLEDVIPKTGGIQSRGKQILQWVAKSFGISGFKDEDFQTSISFDDKPISEAERAVLDRLSKGSLEIISNSLVGSPQRFESLITSGCVALVPNFSHIGIQPDFLIHGDFQTIRDLCNESSLETTIIKTSSTAYGIASAPSMWGRHLLEIADDSLSVYPIINSKSSRQMIRDEVVFSNSNIMWSS